MTDIALRTELPPERWGQRFFRARDDVDLSQIQLAELVSRIHPTSDATIQRLEGLETPPPVKSKNRRRVAILALLACGFDPAAFGLSVAELPPIYGGVERVLAAMDMKDVAEQDTSRNRCRVLVAA